MLLNVGVIGTGNIGTYHINRLARHISGARVAAVYDLAKERAAQVAESVGAKAHSEPSDVIADDGVDAVIVTSPGDTHAEFILASIAADKPVLSEKPLATTAEDGLRVLEAEVVHGRRLVQVGFMRRFDAGYRQVKATIDDGAIGTPLLVHCVHRNPIAPDFFTSEMLPTDSVVHEIDATRWLLEAEFAAATVLTPRSSPSAPDGLLDPQLVILETTDGVIVEVEVFVNAQYGYDVRCEVVGSEGTVELETPSTVSVTRDFARGRSVPADWKERFDNAFHAEIAQWVDGLHAGTITGPSAWDGYAATVVANASVDALHSGQRKAIDLVDKPDFYA
ncbi:MAG TPA: Gfo/Idh/MocA family oxidoreductase [Euzebyales bacterium]|nr:Gfo/Idh/MocA family oxidoreductase [Euzebyales bacterium]